MYTLLTSWPEVSRNPEDIKAFFGKLLLGLDFEWDKNEMPTLQGVSDGVLHVSVPFDVAVTYLRQLVSHPEINFVGHNIIGADLQILKNVDIEIPLDRIDDTIILHWLVNMHLSKSSGKAALEEDAGEKRGRGFNNLWTMASLYTDLPHWKDCRGAFCEGPCPDHDEPWYNGLDAAAPVLSLPHLKRAAKLRGLENLYEMHKELAVVLADMREYGVFTNVPYIDQLRADHEQDRESLAVQLPFNPNSREQVLEFFDKKYGIKLDDNQEETIREAVEDAGGEDMAPEELVTLLEYKELGNGPDRWFQPYYIGKDGYQHGFLDPAGFIHPHLSFFTSSARLMCSSPNLQNVAKRRKSRRKCECGHMRAEHQGKCLVLGCSCEKFRGEALGKKIRAAFIAPPGWYIVRADLSNAENRVVLHLSGYEIGRDVDLHAWVRDIAGLTEDMEFSQILGNAREAAKSIQHAGNILEGLQLKTPQELRAPKIKSEIANGARVIYPQWTFEGKVVTFTGVNLARRAFGDASWANRKKALQIADKYFSRFPGVRSFQQRVSQQCEREHAVRPPNGYVTLSYGAPDDRMKQAQGIYQQQPVAHVTKLALLNMHRRWRESGLSRPVLQVHDEIIAYVRNEVDPQTAMGWIQKDMEIVNTDGELKGLVIPAEPSWGSNWRDQNK